MSAIVVFESMFGNTQEIAEAIAEGLRAAAVDARKVEVGSAPDRLDDAVGMVVVGGPTHAFGMTRPGTREGARHQADRPTVTQGIGLREWLESIPDSRPELLTATFDTRVAKVRHLPPQARPPAARRNCCAGRAIELWSHRRASTSATPWARCSRASASAPVAGARA